MGLTPAVPPLDCLHPNILLHACLPNTGLPLPARYTSTNSIATGWNTGTFTDTTWSLGRTRMGYGAGMTWNTALTDASTGVLRHYFRTKFCVSATRLTWLRQQQLQLKVLADNGADVYLNGVRLLADAASDHDPMYWNKVVNVFGNNSAFVSGECLVEQLYSVRPAPHYACSAGEPYSGTVEYLAQNATVRLETGAVNSVDANAAAFCARYWN